MMQKDNFVKNVKKLEKDMMHKNYDILFLLQNEMKIIMKKFDVNDVFGMIQLLLEKS